MPALSSGPIQFATTPQTTANRFKFARTPTKVATSNMAHPLAPRCVIDIVRRREDYPKVCLQSEVPANQLTSIIL